MSARSVDGGDGSRSGLVAPEVSGRVGKSDVLRALEESGLSPRKSLGQNFLVDPNVAGKMCRIARVEPGDCVLEVGPGIGSLTSVLVAAGAFVMAVEKDPGLAALARRRIPEALVVCADALENDVIAAASQACEDVSGYSEVDGTNSILEAFAASSEWKLVSNLPYSVGTTLFLHLLEKYPKISSGAVMLQAEVAERLCADPASRSASAATLILAYRAEVRIAARIPPSVFYPRPHVDSAIVEFERRKTPPVAAPEDLLFALIRSGFSSRRKMLKNALSNLKWFSMPEEAEHLFSASGVDPSTRAEHLGLEGFGRLARAVASADPGWRESLG